MSNVMRTIISPGHRQPVSQFQSAGTFMIRSLLLAITTLPFALSVASVPPAQADEPKQAKASQPVFRDDVIAKVGDQPITFDQLNTMLNSSAIVGLSIPELGSPERDQVRLTLLDRVISANLLYLDALEQGGDKDPAYQRDLDNFSDSMLALVYKRRYLTGQVEVTDEEIETFFDNNITPGTERTDEARRAVASKLRKQKVQMDATDTRARLREGVPVAINVTELDPAEDALRDDAEVVAEIDGKPILWGEVRVPLSRPASSTSVERRISAMEELIDTRIMAIKGRAAGLEQDPAYLRAFNEFKKVRLINLHREKLVEEFAPSDEEILQYYAEHREELRVPERRKVQIVVLETREDAEAIKKMLETGTITMYQAARDHSIIPASDKTLGEIGWVTKGTGFPELDKLAFSLEPGALGGPVETPNGWHLVQVQDMEEAIYDDPEEERTRRMTRRRMINERLNAYVVALREKSFPVEVYGDKLSYHMQKEIDWYNIKAETGTQPPEKVYQEIDKLRSGKVPALGGQ
jgi:parvulin-like peptidyl-prolyl isomerase